MREQGIQLGLGFEKVGREKFFPFDPTGAQREKARQDITAVLMPKAQEQNPVIRIVEAGATTKDCQEAEALIEECDALNVPINVESNVVILDTPNETGGDVLRGTVILLNTPNIA